MMIQVSKVITHNVVVIDFIIVLLLAVVVRCRARRIGLLVGSIVLQHQGLETDKEIINCSKMRLEKFQIGSVRWLISAGSYQQAR